MRHPKSPDIDPADLPPPSVIARQIADDLQEAARQIRAIIRDLEGPPEPPEDGQLALDL